jgi:AraC-like DNA-binding protein
MNIQALTAQALRYDDISIGKDSMDTQLLPGLLVFRRDAPSALECLIYQPIICLILQGSKQVHAGRHRVDLTPGDALLVSHHLPVNSRIIRASAGEPYLALILSLDISTIRGLYEQVGEAVQPEDMTRAMRAARIDAGWAEPLLRYLDLMDNRLEAEVLGPGILREIHFRLLMSPLGGMLRNLLSVDSQASRVARAIARLQRDYRDPITIPELARTAGMSLSSFHAHFRTVTGTTPLQYQKDLRMIEARRLLGAGAPNVAAVAFEVGYESATQFSREYSRKFGISPGREAQTLAAAE